MEWFSTLVVWYLYLFALGILFFPVAYKIFGSFVDHGYAFAKTIAIILLSYAIFVLGILHVLPFTKESLFLILIVMGLLVSKFCAKEIQKIRKLDKRSLALMIGIEVAFFLGLVFLSVIRGHEPSIHGLEKFMDFGFMQSIGKSTYFPPLDMWLSADDIKPHGYPINYYYFGHLTGAVLIKLSGISAFAGYNLILATIFAQGITMVFTLTASITQKLRASLDGIKQISTLPSIAIGILGSFIVNLGGNLHTIYLLTTGYPNEKPIPFWQIFQPPSFYFKALTEGKGLFDSLVAGSSYWYPNATRFIPFTIHEFPAYSYVVADLHGHVFDIPFVILTLALIFLFFEHLYERRHEKRFFIFRLFDFLHQDTNASLKETIQAMKRFKIQRQDLTYSILTGFMIAINYMTNAFDGPIYLLLVFALLFFLYRFSIEFIIHTSTVLLTFVLVSLPFSWFFDPFAKLIGVNCSPDFLVERQSLGPFLFEKGNCQVSQPYMLFILWGFFWISALLLITYFFQAQLFKKRTLKSVDVFLILLFAFGSFLVIIPEFFYIKDIYPGHFRANTMFKLGYQAFMFMGVASAVAFYRYGRWDSMKKYILKGIFLLFFIFIFVYPFLSFPSYYPGLKDNGFFTTTPQLDGSQWLATSYPQDKEIIDFINDSISGQPVILEAQGDSYTDHDRISAYTGLPTVAGWWVHQWLWRGSPDVVGKRIPDVEALYQSEDIAYTRSLIRKYHIQYVIVSGLERERYKDLNEEKFSKIGSKIFESSNSLGALYRVY